MARRFAMLAAAAFAGGALAQQPAPPQPAFAAPNLSPAGVSAMAANCAICHGQAGRPAAGSVLAPLAGHPSASFVEAMKAFRDGKREATVMHQIARGFSDAEIAALAAWFAARREAP